LLFTTKYNITGRPLYRNLQEHVLQGNRDNTDVLLYYTTTGRPLLKNLQEHVVQGNRDNTNVLLYYTTTGRLTQEPRGRCGSGEQGKHRRPALLHHYK
jgi:hypothetical protein